MNSKTKYIRIALIVSALLLFLGGARILWPENSDGMQDGTEPTTTQDNQDVPTEDSVTEPTKQDPEETDGPTGNSLNFPFSIPGSDLVIERIESYDGPFLEDGSDKEVSAVTAILLTNTGDEYAEYAEITFDRDGTQLKFVATALQPGGSMIVLEANQKAFCDGTYFNCVGNVATAKEFTMSENLVRVEEKPEGGLVVTNLTEKDIPYVRIYYKFYNNDTNIFVGGITYTATITDLAANESCTVTPSHYLSGYSTIIRVDTYGTDA